MWDTVDPYASSTDASQALDSFKQYWSDRGDTFNGDLAHLLVGKNIGGLANYYYRKNNPRNAYDIASVFYRASNRRGAFGVSGVSSNNSSQFPTSGAVKIVAHEIGHSFGVPHTHSCLWEGGPIDNCAATKTAHVLPARLPMEAQVPP